jgi:uncharacterized protein (DUF1800 family)
MMHARTGRLLPFALTAAIIAPQALALHALTVAAVPDDERTIVHVLNRAAFGPRPGDFEKVKEIGLTRYIDQQLHPDRLADTGMPARLSGLTTLHLSAREIFEQYERPQLEMRRMRQQQQAAGGTAPKPDAVPKMAGQPGGAPGNEIVVELAEQKMLRAVYSERQLQEVLTDFWFNHFNVDARKGRTRFLLTEYDRDAIRPHVLGSFRDLLGATAKSPAMLFYLDNWMSVDPDGPHTAAGQNRRPAGSRPGGIVWPQQPRPQQPGNQANTPRRGLNENYARELMELHTLGVDGGYTQKDVTEVARAFTGWTIPAARLGGAGFRFVPALHDDREKIVLGHQIKAGGGMNDGEQVLDILASHPATAAFIASKLAHRFVSDSPPQALVDRLAERFRETKGDLREVMRTLLMSPEFLSPEAYRAKVKTPFDFVVSAVRATGADLADVRPLVRGLQQLGMPLYQCQPPTGYKDSADAWTNAGALVGRMNFATSLAGNPQVAATLPDRDRFVEAVLGRDISDTTRATIAKASSAPQMAALTFGSPEFQKR